MTDQTDKPLSVRILPDLLAFGIWLALAYFLKWQTRDLVWSLWLSSLTTGYLTILANIGAGAYIVQAVVSHPDFDQKQRWTAIGIAAGSGIFLLGFFSLHFCGFHAGHSVFLSAFFPLDGAPKDGFGDAFVNPPLLWALVFKYLMPVYGLFLIPAFISARHQLLLPLIRAHRFIRAGFDPKRLMNNGAEAKAEAGMPSMQDAMGRPYLNVVRMHCLIFFFALCHFLKLDNFLIYMVVYSVYFFPWQEIKGMLAKDRASAENKELNAIQDGGTT